MWVKYIYLTKEYGVNENQTFKEFMENSPENLRKRLFKIMKTIPDMSMEDIAKEIGISDATLRKFLKDHESPMRFKNLLKIELYVETMEKKIK